MNTFLIFHVTHILRSSYERAQLNRNVFCILHIRLSALLRLVPYANMHCRHHILILSAVYLLKLYCNAQNKFTGRYNTCQHCRFQTCAADESDILLTNTTLAPSSLFHEFESFCEPPLLRFELFQVTCSWQFLFILQEFPSSVLQPFPFSVALPPARDVREFLRHDDNNIDRVLKPRGRRLPNQRLNSLCT